LDDVSFSLDRGGVLGVIGRNGAGKSTLLKILSRITFPDRGHAKIFGRVGSLLEVGTGFHPELTGRENIFLNGAILGMTRAEIFRHFDEIVAFAEIEKFIDTPVKHYSSGMYVRLAFSVAAHLTPEILFFDEVLAVGDINFQQKSLGKMSSAAGEGRSILFVSHQLSQVRRLCDQTLWLESGRVKMLGPTGEVTALYEHENVFREGELPPTGAVLLDWFVTDENGVRTKTLETFGPFSITVRMRSQEDRQHCQISAALKDKKGNLLWGHEAQNVSIPAGQSICVYELDSMPLSPGPYLLEVALYDSRGIVDSLPGGSALVVATRPLLKTSDRFTGLLNIACRFDVVSDEV
jgi:lipopolysaccharide transport system ATP-binding protein